MGPKKDPSQKNKDLEGRYANYFKVGHNSFEFLLEFGQQYTGSDQAELYTRIVTNPVYAKALSEVLRKSIEEYESVYGCIK